MEAEKEIADESLLDANDKEDSANKIRDEVHKDIPDEMDNVDDVQDAVVMSRCQ